MKKPSLRKLINEKLIEDGITSICSYGVRFERGERLQVNDVCHYRAKITSLDEFKDKGKIVELSNSLLPAKEYNNTREMREWVKYIIQRSPFKHTFKTQNMSAAWRYGVQTDVEQPLSQCVAGMIALREGWEFQYIPKNFCMLKEEGISEFISFYLSRLFQSCNYGFMKAYCGGHQAIGIVSFKGAKLLKEGMLKFDNPLKEEVASYAINMATYSNNAPYYKGEVMIDDVSPILFKGFKTVGKGWKTVDVISKKELIANAKRIDEEFSK